MKNPKTTFFENRIFCVVIDASFLTRISSYAVNLLTDQVKCKVTVKYGGPVTFGVRTQLGEWQSE